MIPEMMEIIIKAISKERENAREVVEAIIDSEQNYLFTNDQDYKENRQSIVSGGPEPGAGGMQNQQNMNQSMNQDGSQSMRSQQ